MGEQFVSEPIEPVAGTADIAPMARGEAGLVRQFHWRGRQYTVTRLLATWKSSRREGHVPTGELYLRRHWFRVLTDVGLVMTLYCQRQASSSRRPKARWFLYTIETGGGPSEEPPN